MKTKKSNNKASDGSTIISFSNADRFLKGKIDYCMMKPAFTELKKQLNALRAGIHYIQIDTDVQQNDHTLSDDAKGLTTFILRNSLAVFSADFDQDSFNRFISDFDKTCLYYNNVTNYQDYLNDKQKQQLTKRLGIGSCVLIGIGAMAMAIALAVDDPDIGLPIMVGIGLTFASVAVLAYCVHVYRDHQYESIEGMSPEEAHFGRRPAKTLAGCLNHVKETLVVMNRHTLFNDLRDHKPRRSSPDSRSEPSDLASSVVITRQPE